MSARRWWQAGSTRTRLLVLSAPVALVLIVALIALWTVVVAGRSAATDFADRDADALRADVAALGFFDAVAPAESRYAAGTLAVLDDHLEQAEAHFTAALGHTGEAESCPVRVNLELVTETLGDRAAAIFDGRAAADRFRGALAVVDDAPDGCFTGSTDPDEERRAILDATVARLTAKIAAASVAPPPPPPPPNAAPPPPPSAPSGSAPTEPDARLRLDPGAGDPLDRLRQILRDAAANQTNG